MGWLDKTLDATIVSSFDRKGYERHARRFESADLDVDMEGKVCLVTGANRGLGFAAARGLALRGARVSLLCRDLERGEHAAQALRAQTDNPAVEARRVDMSSPESIDALVAGLDSPGVDVVVHNAGVLPYERIVSSQGLELTVATHVVGPHRLLRGLQPRLAGGRVVFVSSGGMYTKRLDVDAMMAEPRRYDGVAAYAMTKRAQVVLAELWAEQLRSRDVVVHAMHPGWAATPGVQTSLPRFWRAMEHRLRTPDQGADTVVWLAVSATAGRTSGGFWFDRREVSTHLLPWTTETQDQRQRLWALCEQYGYPAR